MARVHTLRAVNLPIDNALPNFGDVVVVHRSLKKPFSFEDTSTTGVCLRHNNHVWGGCGCLTRFKMALSTRYLLQKSEDLEK